MTNIYEQHDKHFAQHKAFVIMTEGEQIGTVSFKYPVKGEGRLYCYFHLHGDEMTRGTADSCGYDKEAAAFVQAVHKSAVSDDNLSHYRAILAAFKDLQGHTFHDTLHYVRRHANGVYLLRAA